MQIHQAQAISRFSEFELPDHVGKVSHEAALAKAEAEYEKFRRLEDAKPSPAEKDFEEAIKKLPTPKPVKPAKKKK